MTYLHSNNFKSLTDASGYLILIKFNKILKLIEFSKFLKYKIDISKNLNRFPRFQFRVKVVYYKVFLFIIGGSK